MSGKKILAVVPARGGSKGIPKKNLRTIRGKTLTRIVAEVCQEADFFDSAVVSTDSDEIAEEAERWGLSAPFRRPLELSGDQIGDVDVLYNAIELTEEHLATEFDVVVMLQPTSPLRRVEDVRGCVQMLIGKDADSVWTVSPTPLNLHPLKHLTVGEDFRMRYYDNDGPKVIARQQLTPTYCRNGVAYAFTREQIMQRRAILGPLSFGYLTEGVHVSIDTFEDLAECERLMRI